MTTADLHQDRIDVYVRQCLTDLSNWDRVPEWARHHAREYFHTVSKQPGFLPVYHALYNAGYSHLDAKRIDSAIARDIAAQAQRSAPVATRPPITRQNALPSTRSTVTTAKPTRSTVTASTPTRSDIFEQSWPSFSNFSDKSAWARAHARNYYHQLNGTRTFLSIFKDLVADAENRLAEQEEDDETLSYTTYGEEDTTFATDGRPTQAETDAGRKALDAICFREYRTWFSAFLQEEDEGDTDMTADERFSLHVGRILRNKTQLPLDKCERVAAGWLLKNKKHLV